MFKQWKDWTLHWNTRLIQSTSSLIETHHCSVHFFRFLPSFFLSYTSPVSSCGKRTCLNVLVQANVSINSNDLGSDLVLDNQVLVVAYLAWTCFSQFSLSFSKRFRHFFLMICSIVHIFSSISLLLASFQNVWPWRQSHWCREHPNWVVRWIPATKKRSKRGKRGKAFFQHSSHVLMEGLSLTITGHLKVAVQLWRFSKWYSMIKETRDCVKLRSVRYNRIE